MSSAVMAEDWEGDAKDAWIDGKLEGSYLLNSELDGFKIGTEVENGNVILTGTVPSDAHKQLAEEIAKNLDGVANVTNNLAVADKGDEYAENDRTFSSRFYDMTTTVGLKSNFAANDELEAHEINIDTKDGVVTLNGKVESKAESMLAEEIASSYDHVSRVQNNLTVSADN
jgi:hyperosmotically inducible periplasmic protein